MTIYYVTLARNKNRQVAPNVYRVEFWGGFCQSVKMRRRFFTNNRERESWCTIWQPRYKKPPGATAKTAIEMVYRAKYERRERHDEIVQPATWQRDAVTGEQYHPVAAIDQPRAVAPNRLHPSDYRADYLIRTHASKLSAGRWGYTIYVRQWIIERRTTWDKGIGSWRTIRTIRLDNIAWTPADARAKAKLAVGELRQDATDEIIIERMETEAIAKNRPRNPRYPIENLHKK
jgi:hypothetical protein